MPQRFLRPGLTTSARWNAVSWPAQSFFIRILTVVDDFGRCDGRAPVLWANCFSVWNFEHPRKDNVNLQQVAGMLQELAAKNLIALYDDPKTGKRVLQVEQWQERIRANVKEKWPSKPDSPESCSNFLQLSGDLQEVAGSCRKNPPSSSSSSSVPSPTSCGGSAESALPEKPPLRDSPNSTIQHAEAKKRLGRVAEVAFAEKKTAAFWSNPEIDHFLDRALPLTEDELALVEWAYALPLEHEFRKATKLRRSFEALLEHLRGEIQKIRTVRGELGLEAAIAEKKERPEPADWRRLFRAEYPEAHLPESFWKLSPELRGRLGELRSGGAKKEVAEVAR